jgi:hypothetical protein
VRAKGLGENKKERRCRKEVTQKMQAHSRVTLNLQHPLNLRQQASFRGLFFHLCMFRRELPLTNGGFNRWDQNSGEREIDKIE